MYISKKDKEVLGWGYTESDLKAQFGGKVSKATDADKALIAKLISTDVEFVDRNSEEYRLEVEFQTELKAEEDAAIEEKRKAFIAKRKKK